MAIDFLEERPAVTAGDARSDDDIVAAVTETVDQLRGDFDARNKLHEKIDQTLFGDNIVSVPEAFRDLVKPDRGASALAMNMATTVVAALTVNPPAHLFQPTGFGDSHQINATLREHFFDASWLRQEEEANAPLFRLFMWDIVTKGEGVIKTVQRSKRAWSDYATQQKATLTKYGDLDYVEQDRLFNAETEEYKRAAAYPIASIDVPPSTFMYLPTEDGYSLCCEVKQVPYYDALVRHGAGLDRSGKVVTQAMGMGVPEDEWHRVMSGVKYLTMLEVWDWKECKHVLLGPGQVSSQGSQLGRGTLARKYKHGYGNPTTKTLRGPYFHARGTTSSSRLPDRAGLSMFYGFLDIFPALDTLLSVQQINALLYGLGAFHRTTPPGADPTLPETEFGRDGTEQAKAEVIKIGEIFPYGVAPIDMPRGGVDLDKAIATKRGLLNLALPEVLQGVVDTTESGYQLSQAIHIARLAFDPLVQNAERALARRTGFESWLIENRIKETCYVWGEPPKGRKRRQADAGWLGIGPDELKGVHRYKVRLNPETPTNRVVDVRLHAEMVSNGFETKAQAIEALGGNPDEVEQGLMLEMLKQDPAVLEEMKRRAFQQLGFADQKALAGAEQAAGMGQPDPGAALQGMGQVFQPGQGGMPIAPGMPGISPGIPATPAGGPGGVPNPPGAPGLGG